ncbi:hypothetical protein KR093_008472 [Drosophila rubida]|uniref:Alpha-carbonic anhydrase domain-containing protein n=1 Tax=Drosophila rubida TaxID=30044 RepID=A0AAD4JU52_9MUSC|nr:hypothetical protein KR093_008472 [Drosophila rubida]
MKIGQTVRNQNPQISGADLAGTYIAEELHLHWGSKSHFGAEHGINGYIHDAEMHIVHRRSIYSDIKTAATKTDGLAVLAIMINFSDVPQTPEMLRLSQGLPEFFWQLSQIVKFQSSTYTRTSLTVGSILFFLKLDTFYTYHGSLTTPGCHEAVHWIVFPTAIILHPNPGHNIYSIKYENGKPLVNNNRKITTYNPKVSVYDVNYWNYMYKP